MIAPDDSHLLLPPMCSCGKRLVAVPSNGDYTQIQHGDNPEHCLRLTGLFYAAIEPAKGQTVADAIQGQIRQWTEEIHRWERGEWPTSK